MSFLLVGKAEADKNHDKSCQIVIVPESLDLDVSTNSSSIVARK